MLHINACNHCTALWPETEIVHREVNDTKRVVRKKFVLNPSATVLVVLRSKLYVFPRNSLEFRFVSTLCSTIFLISYFLLQIRCIFKKFPCLSLSSSLSSYMIFVVVVYFESFRQNYKGCLGENSGLFGEVLVKTGCICYPWGYTV